MKNFLLSPEGNYYKANLHCHSTVTDGKLSPEEIKKVYMEQRYSVVAYTDHDLFLPHPELCDEHFLALNGMELEVNEEKDAPFDEKKTCHMCMVALDPDTRVQPLWHRTKYIIGNGGNYRRQVRFDESLPDYERHYTPECISEMMRTGREKGFFVTYNHPRWSMETYGDYTKYDGMHAMEMCNYSSLVAGHEEYCPEVYEELLRLGKKLYCVYADDNHNTRPMNSRRWDSCGGYVMIHAPKLEYRAVTDALVRGDFYASRGPRIYGLWYDDETKSLHVSCSEAKKILFVTGIRRRKLFYAEDEGKEYLTEASFAVEDRFEYMRVTVTDEQGRTADTNAYYVKDFLKSES